MCIRDSYNRGGPLVLPAVPGAQNPEYPVLHACSRHGMKQLAVQAAELQIALDAHVLAQPLLDPRGICHHEKRHLQRSFEREHAALARPENLWVEAQQPVAIVELKNVEHSDCGATAPHVPIIRWIVEDDHIAVSYTHLRAHETPEHLVCR